MYAQSYYVSGVVTNKHNETIPGVNVTIKGTTSGTSTDFNGHFKVKVPGGQRTLVFTGIGFESQELEVDKSLRSNEVTVVLKDHSTELNAVEIVAESESFKIEKKGFTVDALETAKIKSQSLQLNNVIGRSPGVRVRTTGGVGSDFEYTLDGMSGNAIRFFIDGIPMDYYGSSYSINNLPISLIDRIDIYKGVVPVALGSDALGGAINLVTDQNISNYLEASYSFGSFNTHRASVHGQWKSKSGLTTRLSTFYTYSDNNYDVWGDGVFYADQSTGGKAVYFTKENPAERFNDDFQTTSVKFDVGFTNKKWADQFFLALLLSDQKKGIQTGQTMGHVYGEMRNNEKVLMPSIVYQKDDLIISGLSVNAFLGYSVIEATTIDTTANTYQWNGNTTGLLNPSGGELGRNGRSLYSLQDRAYISRLNTTYQLPADFKLGFNFLYTSTERTGSDPYAEEYEIPFLKPQNINTHFAGLSLETIKLNGKLHANTFLKKYGFESSINRLEYTTEYETIVSKNSVSNWGGGFAASYQLFSKLLIKSSVEQATRLPTATEALGDGVTLVPNDTIKPEESFNANLSLMLGRFELGKRHGVKVTINTFYRNLSNKLQRNTQGGQETSSYINIRKVGGTGAEMEIVYDYDQKLRFNINGTYLNMRNKQKIDENGNENKTYNDRLRNRPYLLANAGLEYGLRDVFQKRSKLFMYAQSSYVHEFYLRWPSLGDKDSKSVVPTQLVFDAGIGYTFPSQKLTIAADLSNIFNEQVYDNFLLQKPGRAIFLKINYRLNQI